METPYYLLHGRVNLSHAEGDADCPDVSMYPTSGQKKNSSASIIFLSAFICDKNAVEFAVFDKTGRGLRKRYGAGSTPALLHILFGVLDFRHRISPWIEGRRHEVWWSLGGLAEWERQRQ